MSDKLPNISSLRDVGEEDFEKYNLLLPETIEKRCRHVITENKRTLATVENLRKEDLEKVGQLMFASHESLRDDYEVSCAELDELVEIARKVKGVFGARMTGGGFGGCTVNLLKRDAFGEFQKQNKQKYSGKFGFAPEIYLFQASDGASEIS